MSDEGGRFATPLDVLQVNGSGQAIAPVAELARREGVQQVLLGLPLNMDDTVGPAARGVIAWAKAFREQCPLPVLFVDERLSSFAAEQHLIDRKRGGEKLTRARKKEQLDAIAAADFLQSFLDGRLQSIDVGAL